MKSKLLVWVAILAVGMVIGVYASKVGQAEARPVTSYQERDVKVLEYNARWMEACIIEAKNTYMRQLGQMRDLDPHLVMAMALRLYDTSD